MHNNFTVKLVLQQADDEDGVGAASSLSAEALHSEALQELAAVQAAATAAMAETTDLRRRNESLEAEVKVLLGWWWPGD